MVLIDTPTYLASCPMVITRPIVPLDLSPGEGLQNGHMENIDRETLRALADEGNETALDRLADLADATGDLAELSELLDEGSMRAGFLLTRRAVSAGDLRELQRISDAGYDDAGRELDRMLKTTADEGNRESDRPR